MPLAPGSFSHVPPTMHLWRHRRLFVQQTGSPVVHEDQQKLLWKQKAFLLSKIVSTMRAREKASDSVAKRIAVADAVKSVKARAKTRTEAALATEAKAKESEESRKSAAVKEKAKEASPMTTRATTKASGEPLYACPNRPCGDSIHEKDGHTTSLRCPLTRTARQCNMTNISLCI